MSSSDIEGLSGIDYFIFAGGGMNTAHYAGMIKALENILEKERGESINIRDGLHLKGCGGTSGGALYALFVVLGMKFTEIENVLTQTKISTVANILTWKNILNLIKSLGFHDDLILRSIVETAIKSKFPGKEKTMTLKQLKEETGCQFGTTRVEGYSGQIHILKDDQYPNILVVDAVVDSMRIPPFVRPAKTETGHRLIDGGVLLNFPFEEIFHCQSKTLGINLVSRPPMQIDDPLEWGLNLFRLMQNEIERLRFSSYDPLYCCLNILSVEVDPNDSINFSMSRSQIDAMVDKGMNEMIKFLERRNQILQSLKKLTSIKDSDLIIDHDQFLTQ